MKKFEIATKPHGMVLGTFEGDTAEEALLKAVDELGDWEVAIDDIHDGHPTTRHFDSVRDALKVFVPEAIVNITEVQ